MPQQLLVVKSRPALSCCSLRSLQPVRSASVSRPTRWVVRAQPNPEPSSSAPDSEGEDRLEALEASIRGKAAPPAARKIPIRGMNDTKPDNSNMAPWKEGQLFPEGFSDMPLGEQITEIYMGRRGLLFWLNKIAYASVFVVIGGWVVFRFVLPALGVYQLPGDFQPPAF